MKDRIAAAALAILEVEGPSPVSMRRVAAAAGVTPDGDLPALRQPGPCCCRPSPAATVYNRLGDSFGWLCLAHAGGAVALTVGLVRRAVTRSE